MTKFEELCQASNRAVVENLRLKERCYVFGAALATGLVAYLECPPDRANHYNLQDMNKSPIGPVAILDQATFVENGWWHVGIGMDFTAGPPGTVGNFIFFNLIFKPENDHYLVRFGRNPEQFVIHPDNPSEFENAYHHFFQTMKD